MKVDCTARSISPTGAGFVVLFMNDFIKQCVQWLNEFIQLQGSPEINITAADVYRYVAILLLSHCSGFSFGKTISILQLAGSTVPCLERVRFITGNILAYSPTGRGDDGIIAWNSQRDQTWLLSDFENLSFKETQVFFSSLNLFATLDDDLFGTRAADNQVKMLSSRKADKEGHSADAIADALFRITLAVRFRRRGKVKTESVKNLVSNIVDNRGEEALNGCIVTADRGYGKESFLQILMEQGLASIFVMPQHLTRCHPFVGRSFLNSFREDELEESSRVENEATLESSNADINVTSSETDGRSTDPPQEENVCNGPTNNNGERILEDLNNLGYDRRAAFEIEDTPGLGPQCFFASKRVASGGARVGLTKMTAVAMREYGTEKFAKVLRFLYTVPEGVQGMLNTWVAVPKANVSLKMSLFSNIQCDDPQVQLIRTAVETKLLDKCEALTMGQGCADWFVLRQFRVTGTNADNVLMRNNLLRSKLGVQLLAEEQERTLKEWFSVFQRGWFNSKVSTETMMRGSSNESAVINSVCSMPIVSVLFEIGMVAAKDAKHLACSPDGIAMLEERHFEDLNVDGEELIEANGKSLLPVCVEIKTRVAPRSLGDSVQLPSAGLIVCEVGDETLRKYVPEEHMAQILHQLVVMGFSFSMCVTATETGLLYVVLSHCSDIILSLCQTILTDLTTPLVKWAYGSNPTVPEFIDTECEKLLYSRHQFWRIFDCYVHEKGPFVPLKLFKHGSQCLYSKTKAGVDGATQQRAILRSSTSHFKWEQKLVSQTLKTLAINAFFA